MNNSLQDTIGSLRILQNELTCIGRLQALSVLAHGALNSKSEYAESAHKHLKSASKINAFLNEYYRVATAHFVGWPEEYNPAKSGVLNKGIVVNEKLNTMISELCSDAAFTVEKIKSAVMSQPLLAPVQTILSDIFIQFYDYRPSTQEPSISSTITNKESKSLTGPSSVPLDEAFIPTYSLLQKAVPGFGDTAKEVVPYFWGLAIRESLAADLCALSIIEYDGLPLQFYIDMSKQSWDEMRHSVFFFDKAIELLPDLLSELNDDDPLIGNINQFQSSGKGLPIPKERNLYEAILNASLVERLILLHRDTETPGIIRIKEKISSPFSVERPWLADALTIVMRDEVTHAGFGKTWLEYLVPDKDKRENIIEDTELLRGIYLLTSFAHHENIKLSDLVERYASGKLAPVSPITATPKQNYDEILSELNV